MNKTEANEILSEQTSFLRKLSYSELRNYMDAPKTSEIVAKSGKKYQTEIQAFWDNKPDRNIRIWVSIDDGGWRAFFPMTECFILSPDGSFVGEKRSDDKR